MSALREAAQQALEALENSSPDNARPECVFLDKHQEAITALRSALSQPEQEPYCYVYEYDSAFGLHREFYPGPYNGKQKPDRTVPLYTHPPRREWQGLTEEEILLTSVEFAASHQQDDVAFARAIEAKLKEKNNG